MRFGRTELLFGRTTRHGEPLATFVNVAEIDDEGRLRNLFGARTTTPPSASSRDGGTPVARPGAIPSSSTGSRSRRRSPGTARASTSATGAGLRALLADDVRARYGNAAAIEGADELVDWIFESTAGCLWQHHLLGVARIVADGDRASALVSHTSHRVMEADPDAVAILVGRYHDETARRGRLADLGPPPRDPVGRAAHRPERIPRERRRARADARMTGRYPHLLEPGSIGNVSTRNRVVQLPMGTGLVSDGRVTERDAALQEERARGGVGLIVTGSAHVHPTSRFPARIVTEAWDKTGVEALRRRVELVHRHGTLIFGQLQHLGREAPGGLSEMLPVAPSPVASPRTAAVPHELSAREIRVLVEAYGSSAANFRTAGYDGIEIHAAHGYLVAQFLSPASNRRLDAYRGDALEGRLRFLREIVEEIRDRCGPDVPLGAG